MKKSELIQDFVKKEIRKGKASNVEVVGDDLYNYSTIIAYRAESGTIWLNGQKYSSTTSTNQNIVRRAGEVYREYWTEDEFMAARAEDMVARRVK
jgi:hypothetical protein